MIISIQNMFRNAQYDEFIVPDWIGKKYNISPSSELMGQTGNSYQFNNDAGDVVWVSKVHFRKVEA